ncbi:MAG: class I SAM-dependent methyltransferase [Candidatus Peribacteria bacterium]|nr:class I SAM-dependent methyltransferase [Candidatus Peribacteria bacterium]
MPRKPSFDIIDLGAGDGRMFYQLRDIPHETYIALDISKEMLVHHPKGAKPLVANLEEKLPLKDDSFDIAISFFTTEHLENISIFFSEAYRILRPEGKLFIGHFFQRREFERTAKNRDFKIKQFRRSTEDLQAEATQAFFQTEIFPLYDKADHNGDLLICTK